MNTTLITIMGLSEEVFAIVISIAFALFFVLAILIYGLNVVNEDEVMIVEKFHNFYKIKRKGIRFVFPLIFKCADIIKLRNNIYEKTLIKDENELTYKFIFNVIEPKDYFYQKEVIMSELNDHVSELLTASTDSMDDIKKVKEIILSTLKEREALKTIEIKSFFITKTTK